MNRKVQNKVLRAKKGDANLPSFLQTEKPKNQAWGTVDLSTRAETRRGYESWVTRPLTTSKAGRGDTSQTGVSMPDGNVRRRNRLKEEDSRSAQARRGGPAFYRPEGTGLDWRPQLLNEANEGREVEGEPRHEYWVNNHGTFSTRCDAPRDQVLLI